MEDINSHTQSAFGVGEDDESNISLSRSDGMIYDLQSVYSLKSNVNSENEYRGLVGDAQKSAEVDTGNILISRSDGAIHDIIQVFKGNSDAKGDTLKLEKRSMSLGKVDLSFLTAGFTGRSSFTSGSNSASSSSAATSTPLYYPKTVRIVHMSDTHDFLSQSSRNTFMPFGDILVHTGDFTNNGTDEEFAQFNQWLGSISSMYHYRIVCLGNHDVKVFGTSWDSMKAKLSNATHVLCHEEATVLGIRFYSCPWHWGHKSNYTVRVGAPSSTSGRFEDIPESTQVLLTHGPAYGRLDGTAAAECQEHWGSRELGEAIRRVRPGLHLHGHVKDSRGVLFPFGNLPLTVNSCMVDKAKTVLYACPHVIKAVQTSDCSSLSPGAMPQWIFSLDTIET